MSLANGQHAITLNGQGYTLIEESRRKRAQQAFSPRFATGDPGLTDLSFWQFMSQETWNGGAGQKDFDTVSKHRESSGMSFLRGKPGLAGGNETASGVSLTATSYLLTTANDAWAHSLLRFYQPAADSYRQHLVLVAPRASPFTVDSTLTAIRAATADVCGISQIFARAGAIWRTDEGASAPVLLSTNTGTSCKYTLADGTQGDIGLYLTADVGTAYCVIPYDAHKFLYIGTLTGKIAVARVGITHGSFAGTSTEMAYVTGVPGNALPTYAIDSSSTIYFATCRPWVSGTSPLQSDHAGSAVVLLTATDVAASSAPVISDIVQYPDMLIGGIASMGGSVYIFGARVYKVHDSDSSKREYRNTVIKFPNTVVWESEDVQNDANAAGLIRAVHQLNRNEVLFVSPNSLGSYNSIMRLTTGDVVEEVAAVPPDAGESASEYYPTAVNRIGGSYYTHIGGANVLKRSRIDQSLARNPTSGTSILRLSAFGGNTPLITKTLYSVTIELSEAISTGETMTVKVGGTTVGTMVPADGTRKEIILSTEITSSAFDVTLNFPGTMVWPGTVEKVTVRYIPTQFKKLAWSIGVRATRGLKLIDGTRETRSPATMVAALFDAWEANTPITFVDVDGVSYTVIVTDIDEREPLINAHKELESLLFLELLQC